MTDEMRVALVAVAMAEGASLDIAWALVDEAVDEAASEARPVRELVTLVADRARADTYSLRP